MTLDPCRCVGVHACLSCEISAMRRRHHLRRAVAAGVPPVRAAIEAYQLYPSEPPKRSRPLSYDRNRTRRAA